MNFDESVKTILQGKEDASPVTQGKKAASPVRDLAGKYLKEFDRAACDTADIFQDARHVRDQALAIKDAEIQHYAQVLNRELDNGLLCGGGREGFLDVIRRIDQLSSQDISQDPHWLKRLAGDVEAKRANIGALRAAAAKIDGMVRDLKKLIQEKARTGYTAPNEITPV